MKVTDLMVGDWVQYYDCNLKKQCYAQVTSIQADGIEPYIQTSDSDVYYCAEVYKPIPLIAEILELNGWKYGDWGNEDYTDEYYTIDNDCFDIHIDVTENFEIRTIDGQTIKIKYVHELQHALKLCGINKNIEL